MKKDTKEKPVILAQLSVRRSVGPKKKIGKIKEVKTEDPVEITVVLVDNRQSTAEFRQMGERAQERDHHPRRMPTKKKEKDEEVPSPPRPEELEKVYFRRRVADRGDRTGFASRTVHLPFDEAGKEKKLNGAESSKLKVCRRSWDTPASKADLKTGGRSSSSTSKPAPPAPEERPTDADCRKAKGPIGADPQGCRSSRCDEDRRLQWS